MFDLQSAEWYMYRVWCQKAALIDLLERESFSLLIISWSFRVWKPNMETWSLHSIPCYPDDGHFGPGILNKIFYLMSEKLLMYKKYIRDTLFFKAEDLFWILKEIWRESSGCIKFVHLSTTCTPQNTLHMMLYISSMLSYLRGLICWQIADWVNRPIFNEYALKVYLKLAFFILNFSQV